MRKLPYSICSFFKISCFLFCIAVFTGCKSTLPVSHFDKHQQLTGLNGIYSVKKGMLPVPEYAAMRDLDIENFEIRFNGKDSMTFLWYGQDSLLNVTKYKGEIKDNFFEINIKKNNIIAFPIFLKYERDRLRLGLTADNSLITHFWHDQAGGIFIIVDGYDIEVETKYERLARKTIDGKNGFVTAPDSLGNSKRIIAGQYALQDKNGKNLTDYIYDFIDCYDSEMDGYKVTRKDANENKFYGYIDKLGKVIIPVNFSNISNTNITGIKKISIYKDVENNTNPYPYFLNGVITRDGFICPPILVYRDFHFVNIKNKALHPDEKYSQVVYNDKNYLLGLDGYLYPYTEFLGIRKIDAEKRIKVGYHWGESLNDPDNHLDMLPGIGH